MVLVGIFGVQYTRAVLELEDGTVLEGKSFGAASSVSGEAVFTTGMVGYPESLTDPSYKGQILVPTYPLVGNYGVPDRAAVDAHGLPRFFESDQIHVAGLVVQDYSSKYSHWNAASSLSEWLAEQGVPAIHGIDTRLLTKRIRNAEGALLARILVGEDAEALLQGSGQVAVGFEDPNVRNLVDEVSVKQVRVFGEGNAGPRILAVDCGIKYNMIREFLARDCVVKVVPWDHDIVAEQEWYDGLFISNGPGDPAVCAPLISNLSTVLSSPTPKPTFGICLGNQLVGIAAGCSSYKLPFGNRGQNQPVLNALTGEAFITPQNHGFAIDASKLEGTEWVELFRNANDGTNEGVMHRSKPFFTAQFHPEAHGGPVDTTFLFDMFLDTIETKSATTVVPKPRPSAQRIRPKKVLILGSGGLSIGQAGEFDYSGAQAIKALKEEGVEVVLMNPNIASVQTNHADERSGAQADKVYFLPVTSEFVEMLLRREQPDGIVISMGGQTALNVGVDLHDRGLLASHGTRVLGTQIDAIKATEDRDIFAAKLREIGEKLAPSHACDDIEQAVEAARDIGYPCMIRSAYALGGLGSGICEDEAELRDMCSKAFAVSPQVLVEKSLKGWKEVEYEVVRDAADNCVTVCNMENFDPLGIHTGESIVVAPSQTLTNEEYHMLRRTAINVVRHVGIVGECNIQYALDPHSLDYCIIEVNARLSRSSALASKATGYPLAAVAAKLALNIPLPELENAVTKRTTACFEPSLDYCVVKIPRWDLSKFDNVSQEIGSAMKSVGEVMAIGRGFEESLQKALRMVDPSIRGFEPSKALGERWADRTLLEKELTQPTDKRPDALAYALQHRTHSLEELHDLTKIDLWFLERLERINTGGKRAQVERVQDLDRDNMRLLKQLGFSDEQIAKRIAGGASALQVREHRVNLGVRPAVKQIDTLSAEYPAQTNYLYMTYVGDEDDVSSDEGGVMVLGSGTYRIGSSVEFDWCSVSAARTLRSVGRKTIVVNYNPETVSTDYDESDRLYFEELSLERVLDVYEKEAADGVVVSVGGQIPNNLALPLHHAGVTVLGTSPEMIDSAEDRFKFSKLMDAVGVGQPAWSELKSNDEAFEFAKRVGFPVLVRPSYVLSGAAMSVAYNDEELGKVLNEAVAVSPEHPVVITKFMDGALEIEFDGVAKDGKVIAQAVSEHVENAGVHSGDATLILPPQTLSTYYIQRVRDIAARVASALNITGPFNMQLLADRADVTVIECNLRASRSFPFVSKTVGADFVEAATRAMVGVETTSLNLPGLDAPYKRPSGYVGIKSPMFSFTRLRGADPVLGVEMASTGEVACFGETKHEAFLKSLLAANFKIPEKSILIASAEKHLHDVIHPAFALQQLGFTIYATPDAHKFFEDRGFQTTVLHYPEDLDAETLRENDLLNTVKSGGIDLVVNLPEAHVRETSTVSPILRRAAVDYNVPLLTNANLFTLFAEAMQIHRSSPSAMTGLDPEALHDHYKKESDLDAWSGAKEFH